MANNLQTKLPKDVIKNVVSGESITASLQNQIIDRLNSFPEPKALVSDLEDSQPQTWHLWRLNEFQFTGDLIVDDPLTWDYVDLSIYSDARNGTGSDNTYSITVEGYGVQ